MKSGISLAVAVVLAVAGGVCWLLGRSEREVAATRHQLATMHYLEAADHAAKAEAMITVPSVKDAAGQSHAAADYWLGKYDAFASTRDASGNAIERTPAELLVTANASYRAALSQFAQADRQAGLQHLEGAIKNYSDAMKSDPQNEDAAYNYEFAIRMRETFSRLAASAPAPKSNMAPASIHGRLGAPPKGPGMSEFKVIVPQRPDERKEDKQAGKGEKRTKKG
jgi:hypothetical protein